MTVEQIEAHNVAVFKEFGHGTSNIARYRCTKCEQSISIERSMSRAGHNLICNNCIYSIFGSQAKAFAYVYEETTA